jgi:colicin import membrane protein
MREEAWFKMLVISAVLHMLVIAAFSIPIKKGGKKIDLSSSYSVNLVGGMGPSGAGAASLGGGKAIVEKPTPPSKTKKVTPTKKPVPTRKEKEKELSISKKKVPPKETPSKEELSRLDEKIRELKKKTDYLDVTQKKGDGGSGRSGPGGRGAGLPVAGSGGGQALDPATQRYMLEVWEKISNAWGLPGMSSFKKSLEMVVTIKVRKDGRIVDIEVEERSGNRVYDESVLRVLRAVDPLPAIPPSLNVDSLEIGFRFRPGELS